MKRILPHLLIVLILSLAAFPLATADLVGDRAIATALLETLGVTPPQTARFAAIDILIDPQGKPLAAWQIELDATPSEVQIVGITAGDAPAFPNPAYYDEAAIQHEKVILADFSLAAADRLPTQQIRIATVNIMITGEARKTIAARLTAAADPDGQPIPASLTILEGGTP